MTQEEYCNSINDKIHEHFREYNNGYDSDVFVDEKIDDDVIAINWHTYNDPYIHKEYVDMVAEYIFSIEEGINTIMSPIKDYQR